MKELWNEITYWLSSCKDRNVLEKEYEILKTKTVFSNEKLHS